MAAGDQIVADRQIELRATLMGAGTLYEVEFDGVSGLGVPAAKTADADLAHAAGSYFGRDYTGPRVLTIPLLLGGTDAEAGAALMVMSATWAASETNLPLHLQVPGMGHIAFNGRPRALLADLPNFRALATFECGDPTMMTVAGPPTIGTATAGPGAGQAGLTWTPPAATGGSPITGYVFTWYRASDSVVVLQSYDVASPQTTSGLTTGVPVYAKVRTENAQGLSGYSAASNTVTPP